MLFKKRTEIFDEIKTCNDISKIRTILQAWVNKGYLYELSNEFDASKRDMCYRAIESIDNLKDIIIQLENNLVSFEKQIKNGKTDDLHDYEIEAMVYCKINQIGVGLSKTLALHNHPSFKCSSCEVIEFFRLRDDAIERSKNFFNHTVEYRKIMWD